MNQKFSRAQFVFVFVFSFLLSAFARMCAVLFIYSTLFAPDFFALGAGRNYPCVPAKLNRTQIIFLWVGAKLRHLMMLL